MKQIREIYKRTGKLHHVYGILGGREKVREEIFSFLTKDLKFPVTDNPDFWQGDFNVFKVDDSRDLINIHLKKAIRFDCKVFVIFANFMTVPAQNTLLKMFEDPFAGAVFFLVMPSFSDLLPTLKSRLILGQSTTASHHLSSRTQDSSLEKAEKGEAEKFLLAKVGKRLEIVAKILKDIKDEKLTKNDAINFVKSLEREICKSKKKDYQAIASLEKAISYLTDEAPSVKVILEHLVLIL